MNPPSLSGERVCVIQSLSGAGCRVRGSERDGRRSKYCAVRFRRDVESNFKGTQVFMSPQRITIFIHRFVKVIHFVYIHTTYKSIKYYFCIF